MMRAVTAVLAFILFTAPVFSQNGPAALTVDDVVKLHQSGISDNVILARIRQANKPLELSTDDLVKLGQAKVSDGVIQALMNPVPGASNGTAATPAPTTAPNMSASANGRNPGITPNTNNAADSTTATGPTNPNVVVREVSLSRAQIDAKKKELDAKSPQKSRATSIADRIRGAATNAVTGDESRRNAAEAVLQQQAHDVMVRENKTVIVAIGASDVVSIVQANLIDVRREIVLLHLDTSISDKTCDNGAIHAGLTGGLSGMATNVWVYLPKSAAGAADAKPDRTLSSKAPGQKQLWTGIFTADGDLPPQVDNKLK
jgi:hypothetical protein